MRGREAKPDWADKARDVAERKWGMARCWVERGTPVMRTRLRNGQREPVTLVPCWMVLHDEEVE